MVWAFVVWDHAVDNISKVVVAWFVKPFDLRAVYSENGEEFIRVDIWRGKKETTVAV